MKIAFVCIFIIFSINFTYSNIIDDAGIDLSYDSINIRTSKLIFNKAYIGVSGGIYFSDDFQLNDPNINVFFNYNPIKFKYFVPTVGLQYNYIYLNEPTFENHLSGISIYTGGMFPIYKGFSIGLNLGYRYGRTEYLQKKRNDYFNIQHKGQYELFPLYLKLLFNYNFL